MHSRNYLYPTDFQVTQGSKQRDLWAIFPNWTPQERVVFVAPDPLTDTARLSPFVLARTALFYGRSEAQAPDFFAYPNHFVVAGEEGSETRLLGPHAVAEWSRAWFRLDVWPSTHHIATAPESANLLTGVFMFEPTVLVWPERLPVHTAVDLPSGLSDGEVRQLLRSHVREVWLYGDSAPESSTAWSIDCTGGAQTLWQETIGRLPDKPASRVPLTCFWPLSPQNFLGQ